MYVYISHQNVAVLSCDQNWVMPFQRERCPGRNCPLERPHEQPLWNKLGGLPTSATNKDVAAKRCSKLAKIDHVSFAVAFDSSVLFVLLVFLL